jgi:hypothetical protein
MDASDADFEAVPGREMLSGEKLRGGSQEKCNTGQENAHSHVRGDDNCWNAIICCTVRAPCDTTAEHTTKVAVKEL